MGLIGQIFGQPAATQAVGQAVKTVAEVLTPNATHKLDVEQQAYSAALTEHGDEFRIGAAGPFDRFINGLNRLPRPMLAFGTIGLFVYAMVDPINFAERMVGLNYVPEPLWWLLTAIVGFYFGAREAHYFRVRQPAPPPKAAAAAGAAHSDKATAAKAGSGKRDNPALDEMRSHAGSHDR